MEHVGKLVKLTQPLSDTINGNVVTIPAGYQVKIEKELTEDIFLITSFTSQGIVKMQATRKELGIEPVTAVEEVVDEVLNNQPLTPRIYQEFGITWLIYSAMPNDYQPTRHGSVLGDAPGVGKTLQAMEAAKRVMMGLTNNIDPLAYCYTQHFEADPFFEDQLEKNIHQNNPHPTSHPMWALPRNSYPFPDSGRKACTVIVAPTHLCKQWFKSLARQYPNDSISLATSSDSTRSERMYALRPGFQWYIVNYEMLRPAPAPKDDDYEIVPTPYTDKYSGKTFYINEKQLKTTYKKPVTYLDYIKALMCVCAIYDESHRLKSSKSKQAQEAAKLSQAVPFNFLLSATPISRESDDIWHQLHIIDSSKWQTLKFFCDNYCMFEQTTYGRRDVNLRTFAKRELWVNRIGEDAQMPGLAISTFNKTYKTSFQKPNLKGYVLGRSYKDVGMYLPETIAATIPVAIEGQTRKIYDSTRDNYKAEFIELGETIELSSYMAVLHGLRFLTAASQNKIEAVQQIIQDNEGPHVIFCAYDLPCINLATMLSTKAITGFVKTADERNQIIQECLAQGKPIVATGGTIGEGINGLEQCKVVIYFEEDYTPGKMYQRTSRVQRYDPNLKEGETKDPILVFYVNCLDSIDERVHEIQNNRSLSIKDIISVELGV